jgi:hypothetical protein
MLKLLITALAVTVGVSYINTARGGPVEDAQLQLMELQRVYNLDKLIGDMRRSGLSVTYVKTAKFDSVFDLTEVSKPSLALPINIENVSQAISAVATVSSYNLSSREIVIVTKNAQRLLNGPPLSNLHTNIEIKDLSLDDSLKMLSSKTGYSIAHFSPMSSSAKKAIISCDIHSGDLIAILKLIMSQTKIASGWTLAMSVDEAGRSPFALIYTY